MEYVSRNSSLKIIFLYKKIKMSSNSKRPPKKLKIEHLCFNFQENASEKCQYFLLSIVLPIIPMGM